MSFQKAISLFLIDGTPDGRIACELFNWTGKAYRIPRKLFKESVDREDLHKAGVYFLFGRGEDSNEIDVAYIGEAEEVYKRIIQHQEEDYWSEVLTFVSKDENLNKAHVKFLEYNVYSKAVAAKRFELKNKNMPNCPSISEVDRAVMTEFFENLKILVGTLGYKIFEPLTKPETPLADQYYINAARGANARAVLTTEGMVVRQDSEAAISLVPSTTNSVASLRDKLISENALKQLDGRLIFTRDYLFSSPSAAACVVMGRNANGLTEWKDANGNTLKENEQSDVSVDD